MIATTNVTKLGARRPPTRFCPYLGLRQDPSVVARYPTEKHQCVSPKRNHRPNLEQQTVFCLDSGYEECPYFAEMGANPQVRRTPVASRATRFRRLRLAGLAIVTILIATSVTLLGTYPNGTDPWFAFNFVVTPAPTDVLTPVSTPDAKLPAATPDLSPQPMQVALLPTVTPTRVAAGGHGSTNPMRVVSVVDRYVTPTAEPGGVVSLVNPRGDQVGWWVSDEQGYPHIGDSFLYAGQYNQKAYVAAVRFDLSRVARGAAIRAATIRLAGLRSEGVSADTPNRWLVQLVAEEVLPDFATADFMTAFSAPAAITLLPELQPGDLGVDRVNEWQLDEHVRHWLEQQRLDGATSFALRLISSTNGDDALFGWDSGYGSESRGNAPAMIVSAGPPPPTPPPLPTRAVVVVTLTPPPANVMTVVAQSATATEDATRLGTATAFPYEIVTPTPFPENLATVQANALVAGLPPVVLNTPVPANVETATAVAEYATAVALTTGTFTPVPTGYVTPVLLLPPPPAENVATAAAQVIYATAAARSGLPTATIPWNGVNGMYVYATPTPGNAMTAVAMVQERNAAALTTGTPTPTPWNLVVITPVPLPTPTPIPIVILAEQLEPTPTPTPTAPVYAQDLDLFRGKILFLSNRTGETEVWAMDPDTGEILALVRDMRLHELARQRYLAASPDGSEQAIVQADGEGDLEIKVYSNTYATTRQLTNFSGATSYDPTWSPSGEWIAFVSTANDGDEIYRTDPQGVAVERLTYNAWEWDKHPAWSPDGRQIVFYSNRGTGRRQLWLMDADGSNQRNLSDNEFEDWDPVWIH